LIAEAKAALRRDARAARAEGDPALGAALRDVILREAPPPPGAVVGGFLAMGREIGTLPLLEALHARGHRLALPVAPPRGQPLAFRAWRPGDALRRGPLGTQEPAEGDALTPDWLIVPLLAFDRTGARLGYGGGYYDRTLAALPGATAIGVAYALQERPAIPVESHDIRLARVATERGIVRCVPPA
jgi:5-formyltetrahydrofolate cyclo-ligase